jgi:natural product precursor
MKKLNKLQINSAKMISSDELLSLKGGASFKCYKYGSAGGWCNTYIGDVYASDCDSALYACIELREGGCVECGGY